MTKFCACGRIEVKDGKCERCLKKKPVREKIRKTHWSGGSKYRKETGEWQGVVR